MLILGSIGCSHLKVTATDYRVPANEANRASVGEVAASVATEFGLERRVHAHPGPLLSYGLDSQRIKLSAWAEGEWLVITLSQRRWTFTKSDTYVRIEDSLSATARKRFGSELQITSEQHTKPFF
jgi:hypothetical protein